MSTFLYCLKQGVINICRNIWFSLASVATISACIFLFCLFFAMVANVQHGARAAEETVGISVFFDEGMDEEQIRSIGSQIQSWSEVREARYISAEEAWESFKSEYFEGMEELAEGFEADNPLANSSSYEIYLKDISDQDMIVKRLEGMEGVRKVRYSSFGGRIYKRRKDDRCFICCDHWCAVSSCYFPDQQYHICGSCLQTEGK